MNNKRFNVGDIVKLKLLGEAHYYMVTDFIDFSANEKDINVDYDIVLIYPVLENPKIEYTIHKELVKVADFKSKEYKVLMDYIVKERIARGFKDIPDNIKHVVLDEVKKPKLAGEKKDKLMFEVGDIVNFRPDFDDYIIIEVSSFDTDENTDTYYTITSLFPIDGKDITKTVNHKDLSLIIKNNSPNYESTLQDIFETKKSMGYPVPEHIKHILEKSKGKRHVKEVKKTRMNHNDIKKILEDISGEIKIEMLIHKMNENLDLLNKAIILGHEEKIQLHKNTLEEIRKELMELEYFTL